MLRNCLTAILLLLPFHIHLVAPDAHAALITASHTRLPSLTGYFHTGAGMAVDGPAVFDNREAQTFLATETGFADQVAFVAHQSARTTAPLRVDITAVVDGLPGASLAWAIVPIDAFPAGEVSPPDLNVAADFSLSGLLLEAGTAYGIVFSSETSNANYRLYGTRADPYPDGSKFSSQNGSPFESSILESDLFFEVTVTPVPEPASVWLAIAGGAVGCCSVGRLRRRRGPAGGSRPIRRIARR